jgi:hypothetical protein
VDGRKPNLLSLLPSLRFAEEESLSSDAHIHGTQVPPFRYSIRFNASVSAFTAMTASRFAVALRRGYRHPTLGKTHSDGRIKLSC